MKLWLARYKYRGSERLAPLIGQMTMFGYEQLRRVWAGAGRSDARIVLSYVPLSARRLEERGFNQSEAIARIVASRYRVPVVPLFVRTRHTEKQSYKSRRERMESLHQAFSADPRGVADILGLTRGGTQINLVLVDDVYTTGSTLQHCGETAMFAMAPLVSKMIDLRIYGLTWAR